jgi:hypothetical protein
MRHHILRAFKRYGIVAGSVAVVLWAGSLSRSAAQGTGASAPEASPTYGVTLPPGYRDWSVISIARVGGPVNDLRVKLGNELAVRTYRDGGASFPDGTIIVRLAYRAVASEENNAVIRVAAQQQGLAPEQVTKLISESVVAGPPLNVQVMVKDSQKYASTGGWGFGQFTNGKADGGAVLKTCFACHQPAKDHDFVYTRYSP